MTREEAARKAMKIAREITDRRQQGKVIAQEAMSYPEGSTFRATATRHCRRLLDLNQKRLEELELYASFAAEVPESVLQDRLR